MLEVHCSQMRFTATETQTVHVCVPGTFLPPGEQVSGGGVLVMFRGLEPQLEGEEPRILESRQTDGFTASDTSFTFTSEALFRQVTFMPTNASSLKTIKASF